MTYREPGGTPGAVLGLLRSVRGIPIEDLSSLSGVPLEVLAGFESGKILLVTSTLTWLVKLMGFEEPEKVITEAGIYADGLAAGWSGYRDEDERGGPLEPSWFERRHAAKAGASMAIAAGQMARAKLLRRYRTLRREEAQKKAEELWKRLKSRPLREQLLVVEVAPEYQSWALCILICGQSRRAAASDAARALKLAKLAVRIAEVSSGGESWRSSLLAFAIAHQANAVRVGGDIPAAEELFKRVKALWQIGRGGDPDELLSEAIILQLEASLRRAQQRYNESLELLDAAMALGADSTQISLKKAFTFEQAGQYKRAVELLRRISGCHLPRDHFACKFNLAVNLCHLGRNDEAAEFLPQIRALAADMGNELDLIRVSWLSGRVSFGLGGLDEAIQALRRAQEQFVARGITFDAVLVSLELALALLKKGRLSEVRELATQLPTLCEAQGLHREATAAVRLFYEAVARQTVTDELARQVIAFLYKARYDQRLKFLPRLSSS